MQMRQFPAGRAALLAVLLGMVAVSAAAAEVKVAVIQYQVRDADEVGRDAARVEGFIREAASNTALLVVAPETCFYRYDPWKQNNITMAGLAANFDALRRQFAALADELDISLVIGLREPLDGKRVHNAALWFGPDGRLLAKHRKVVPSNSEKRWTKAGESADVFDTPFGRVGMLICKDAKTGWWRTFNDRKIDLYVLIAGDSDGRSFTSFSRTCAAAKCVGVLANQVTHHGKGRGNSAFGMPDGAVQFVGGGEGVFYASLPLKTSAGDGPAAGQIVVDPKNPAWLVRFDSDGNHKPFFMSGPGDPEGFLYRGKRRADGTRDGDQMKLIRKLAGTGANCIYLMAVRSHGGDGGRDENPFVDSDPKKGINAKVLDQWEQWFTAMDEAGIVIYFFIYDDSARIWRTRDTVGPAEKRFLTMLVRRFKHHRNLIWCIAEEYQERFSAKAVSRIAAVIRKADDRRHPIAVHKLSGLSFKEFADDPNVDQFAIQYNVPKSDTMHAGMVKAFKEARGRYSLNMSESKNMAAGAGLRGHIWASAMGGAYSMALGMDIATTAKADLEACGHLVRFFEAADPRGLKPRDDLAAADTDYVLAGGGRYILYGSNVRKGLGLKARLAGTWAVRWTDCVTGKIVEQTNVRIPAQGSSFKPPAGFGREAAVYIHEDRS